MASSVKYRSSKFLLRGFPLVVLSALLFGACSGGRSSKDKTSPPVLRIENLQNAAGDLYAPGEQVEVNCDHRLTVLLGPSTDTPHILDNWKFRPPGNCGSSSSSLSQCGYVRLELKYANAPTKLVERATLAVLIDAALVTDKLESITASLIDGRDGTVFKVNGNSVSDQVKTDLSFQDCGDIPAGGAGGGGGPGQGYGGEPMGPDVSPGGSAMGGKQL